MTPALYWIAAAIAWAAIVALMLIFFRGAAERD